MPNTKTKLVEQRWQLLMLGLLLQGVSTVSRSRNGRRIEATGGHPEVKSPTSARARDLRLADATRGGLLALAVAVSVGIHIGLAPEHLAEMPRLGYSFIVAAVLGTAIAAALVARPTDRRIAALAGLFCLAEILVWLLFVTIRVPFFPGTPEPVETIALVSKVVEAIGWALAVGAVGSGEVATRKRFTGAYRASTSVGRS